MSLVVVNTVGRPSDIFVGCMVKAVEMWDNGMCVVLRTGEVVDYLWASVVSWEAPVRYIRDRSSYTEPYADIDEAVWFMEHT